MEIRDVEILYKRDSKGKCRVWWCVVTETGIAERSGLKGGKLVNNNRVVQPKNVGRSNETTVSQQAELERASKYKKKLDTGYFRDEHTAMNTEVLLPMLASEYGKFYHKVDWKNAFVQPKLDGMRCFIIIDGSGKTMISRKGIAIITMDHILDEFPEPTSEGRIILDGELYAHGLTFQENMKLIKKVREGTDTVMFHCYDVVNENMNYNGRHQALSVFLESVNNKYVERIASTVRVYNEGQLMAEHDKNIKLGYEGSMLRHGIDGYTMDKRSQGLLKVKDFIDEVYKVVDVEPTDARPTHGILVCEMPDGRTFKASYKGTHEVREELLRNKENYFGQSAEVRFFEYTDGKLPRFPVCVGFRLDK